MSSVPLPNKSDTDRSAVDPISKQSGDGTEGTGDRLNEAPRDWIMLELACDPDVVGSWDRYVIASVCQEALNALRAGLQS